METTVGIQSCDPGKWGGLTTNPGWVSKMRYDRGCADCPVDHHWLDYWPSIEACEITKASLRCRSHRFLPGPIPTIFSPGIGQEQNQAPSRTRTGLNGS